MGKIGILGVYGWQCLNDSPGSQRLQRENSQVLIDQKNRI